MEAVEMTINVSGNKFFGMINHDTNDVFMEVGNVHFNTHQQLEDFLEFNSAEEVEMTPENFSFFKL